MNPGKSLGGGVLAMADSRPLLFLTYVRTRGPSFFVFHSFTGVKRVNCSCRFVVELVGSLILIQGSWMKIVSGLSP